MATVGVSRFSVPRPKPWRLVSRLFVGSTQTRPFPLVLLHAVFRSRKAHLPPVLEAIFFPSPARLPPPDHQSRAPLPLQLSTLRSLLSSPVSDAKLLPRLGELTVTDVTQTSVGLSWAVPEGDFDSFLVQYKDRGSQLQVVPVAADLREVTIPSLEPNRKYKFLLFGLLGRKRLGPVSVEGTTGEPGPCPHPLYSSQTQGLPGTDYVFSLRLKVFSAKAKSLLLGRAEHWHFYSHCFLPFLMTAKGKQLLDLANLGSKTRPSPCQPHGCLTCMASSPV